MRQCRKANIGFAYLWLLFTIAAIGLSLSLAAELYATSAQRDKEKELLAIGRQFRQAIARYYETQGQGNQSPQGIKTEYPASLEDLLQDPRSISPRRHLRKIFVDPMTGKTEWGLVKVAGRIAGVHSLSEKIPIKQGGFEADDAGFAAKQKYSEWVFTYPADLMTRPLPSNTTGATASPSTPESQSSGSAPTSAPSTAGASNNTSTVLENK